MNENSTTVLVVDDQKHLWGKYTALMPEQCKVRFVRDTMAAAKVMRENPAISVVIVQAQSRRAYDPEFNPYADNLARVGFSGCVQLHATCWNTSSFLELLHQRDFKGLVQVLVPAAVRSSVSWPTGLAAQAMNKQDFLAGRFFSREENLWHLADRAIGRLLDELLDRLVPEDRIESEDLRADLGQLGEVIAHGDVREVYFHVTQMVEDDPRYAVFNHAVWDILEVAGLLGWLQLELAWDMASQNREYPECGWHLDRSYAAKVQRFFRTGHFEGGRK